MATKSSIHIKPCNIASSEAHNRRTAEYIRNIGMSKIYVVSELSADNEQWINPNFGTLELQTHYDNIKRMVKEKTGRAMQEQHGKQIRNLQGIHNQELEAKDKEISRLNTLLEKAFKWFPMLREMLRMEKLCAAIGFTKEMIESLLTKKEAIRCNGRIYSEEHRRKFDIKNDIFKVEKNPTDDSKLILTINKQSMDEWFKEQWNKLRQSLRQSAEEPRKNRGFKL